MIADAEVVDFHVDCVREHCIQLSTAAELSGRREKPDPHASCRWLASLLTRELVVEE
jgi:hypothetical protein